MLRIEKKECPNMYGIKMPKIKRTQALLVCTLMMVCVVGTIMRVYPVRWGAYFNAYDPLFQLRVTKHVLENGFASWFTWYDDMSWYPIGRDIARSSYFGLPFTASVLYLIMNNVLGIRMTIETFCLYVPVLMAMITYIVMYYFGKEIGGTSTGLIASFLLATNRAYLSRTVIGFFDTECVGILGILLIMLFFLRAIKSEKEGKSIVYGVLSGLSLGYLFMSWGASRYATAIITLYVFILLIMKKFDDNILKVYSMFLFIGYFFAIFVPKLGMKFLMSTDNMGIIGFLVFLFVYNIFNKKYKVRLSLMIIPFIVFAVLAYAVFPPIRTIGDKMISVLNPSVRGVLAITVAEHRRPIWSVFFEDFGILIPLSIMGLYFTRDESTYENIMLSLTLITGFYFMGSMTRLALIQSISVTAFSAYVIVKMINEFLKRNKTDMSRMGKRRREFVARRDLGTIFAIVVFISIVPNIYASMKYANMPTTLANSGMYILINNEPPRDWLQALSWMKDNIPEGAVVASWWDYGYWITSVANKTTIADGATMDIRHIGRIATMFMSNQVEGHDRLWRLGASYVVVHPTFNPNNPDQMLEGGDNRKWNAIALLSEYDVLDFVTDEGEWSPKFIYSTLYSLMMEIHDPNLFELIFKSEYGFVKVYRVK